MAGGATAAYLLLRSSKHEINERRMRSDKTFALSIREHNENIKNDRTMHARHRPATVARPFAGNQPKAIGEPIEQLNKIT